MMGSIRGIMFFYFVFWTISASAKPVSIAKQSPSATPAVPTANTANSLPTTMPDTALSLETSLDLRDPFRRPLLKTEIEAQTKKIPELERYEVDQFKLIGMISGLKKNKALLTTPDGTMHIVAENEHIGTRHGVIKKISPSGVAVEEKVVNLLGQEEKVQTVLQFKEKPKEGLRWVSH